MTHNQRYEIERDGIAASWPSKRALHAGSPCPPGSSRRSFPPRLADKLSCLPPQRMSENPTPAPANKKIGVSVAYLKVPFYANFKTGLEDGAKQFGFTYDLVDGNSGDVADRTRQPAELHRPEEGSHPSHAVGRRHHSRHQARQRRPGFR